MPIKRIEIDDLINQHYGIKRATRTIGQAMEVFQKLREGGKWCCLDISSDFHYCWLVKLTRFEIDKHEPEITVSSHDLKLAICFAALLSTERVNTLKLFLLGAHMKQDGKITRIVI